MSDKCNALTDMAYYSGARHAMAALSAGMDPQALSAEMESRVAPARKWLAENRRAQSASPALAEPDVRDQTIARLRAALRKYGGHRVICAYVDREAPCDCGWDAALSGARTAGEASQSDTEVK